MRQPISRLHKVAQVAALAAGLVVLAGCGAGGVVSKGDTDTGKKLFTARCGSCHTLAAAGTSGTIGPNLDDAFAEARANGFNQSAIADIVAGQIREPGQYATGSAKDRVQANMPPHLVTGQDLNDVAEFVAANAGSQGFSQQAAVTGNSGSAIFKAKCGGCHTLAAAGTTGTVGPNLDQLKPALARVKTQVEHGGAIMPAFKGVLSDAQIAAVAKYVSSNAGK